eukprot:COSAG01_NODE_52644_length_345_cov_0.796748_1_plen_48_part_10
MGGHRTVLTTELVPGHYTLFVEVDDDALDHGSYSIATTCACEHGMSST